MKPIETVRLHLRPFEEADLPAYIPIRGHPEVMRYLSGPGPGETPADVATRIFRLFRNHWEQDGYGPWAVVLRENGRLIGQLGLRNVVEFDEVELLWSLHPDLHGQGLATEGGIAARDYAFQEMGLRTVFAMCDPDNLASQRIMAKIGLHQEADRIWHEHANATWRLNRDQWQPASPASYRKL